MANQARTFRIFVSSTFSDLKAERNALQAYVFPRLRELVRRRAKGHASSRSTCAGGSAMRLPSTSKPWTSVWVRSIAASRPAPAPTLSSCWATATAGCRRRPRSRRLSSGRSWPGERRGEAFLDEWYRKDDQRRPARTAAEAAGKERPTRSMKIGSRWSQPAGALSRAVGDLGLTDLLHGLQGLGHRAGDPGGSAGEGDAPEHVVCFFRHITNLPVKFDLPAFQKMFAARLRTESSGVNRFAREWLQKSRTADSPTDKEIRLPKNRVALTRVQEREFLDFMQQVLVDFVARDFINLPMKIGPG